jgi:hypothetical protein
MEEFGFFSHIYEHLPPEVTAVFEIARVLEDEDAALTKSLSSILRLPPPDMGGHHAHTEEFSREIPTGEEYEADYMQSHRDVSRIYPWQFCLPDELFSRRLAERTLWMPIAKAPRILPIETVQNSFGFDSRKQKVYVLFDTSSSMSAHHRIYLAKAILYTFLKRNMEEMGFISVRTFDDHVGEVHTAVDGASFESLIRYTLRLTHLGDGTVLQKALLTALDDIQNGEHLAGAEILIITDGAVALDEAAIRAKLDVNTRIHTLKIGHATVYPSDALIDDALSTNPQYADKYYLDLIRQERELRLAQKQTNVSQKSDQHQHMLHRIAEERTKLAEKFKGHYGRELERLSSVYINIDDLSESGLFLANEETIGDLESIAASLEAEAKEFLTTDTTKKLAILHDHIAFLIKYESNMTLLERLKTMDAHLKNLLGSLIRSSAERKSKQKGESGESSASDVPISEEDLRDLRFILEIGGEKGDANWLLLLTWLWKHTIVRASRALHRKVFRYRRN